MESNRLNNIGSNLYKEGKRQAAFSLITRALQLDPKNVEIQINYGCLLTNFGRYEESHNLFNEIVKNNPNNCRAWHGFGVLNLVSGYPQYAKTCFQNCIKLNPRDFSHKFDLACATIQNNEWEEGLELYEIRREWKPERTFDNMEPWQGEHNQKVYVWAEQGIGDTIQYSRYIPWLASISKSVTFAVPDYLFSFMKHFSKYARLVPFSGAMVDTDYQVPLMSLHKFNKQFLLPADFTANSFPSLKSDKKKVGLCWACNPSSANFRERSVDLDQLLKLTELDYEFHSLQLGDGGNKHLIIDHPEIYENWEATRDIIASCDYVVSTDTSVAHLAASMNIPTIMLLARRDWWRWGNDGETTVWYPSMTIIRQEIPFKWEKEINKAYAILKAAKERKQTLAA